MSTVDLTELPIDIREEILAFTSTRVITQDVVAQRFTADQPTAVTTYPRAFIVGPLESLFYRYTDDETREIRVVPNAVLAANEVHFNVIVDLYDYYQPYVVADNAQVARMISRRLFKQIRQESKTPIASLFTKMMRERGIMLNYVKEIWSVDSDIALEIGNVVSYRQQVQSYNVKKINYALLSALLCMLDIVKADKIQIDTLEVDEEIISEHTTDKIESINKLRIVTVPERMTGLELLVNISKCVSLNSAPATTYSFGCKNILINTYNHLAHSSINAQRHAVNVYINNKLDSSSLRYLSVDKECSVRRFYCNRRCNYDQDMFTERVDESQQEYKVVYERIDGM